MKEVRADEKSYDGAQCLQGLVRLDTGTDVWNRRTGQGDRISKSVIGYRKQKLKVCMFV